MQVDFDSIQPETIEHFKGGEGSQLLLERTLTETIGL